MSTAIRRKGLNQTACPIKDDFCREPRNHFDVLVKKNDGGPAKPVYVHIYGLPEGEELHISRIYDDGCDPLYSPLFCGGNPMALDCQNPDIMLIVPGKYRFQTASLEMLDDVDFTVEESPVHKEYADLWLKQQQLCCCRDSKRDYE